MASSSDLPNIAGAETTSGLIAFTGLAAAIAPWLSFPAAMPWPGYLNAIVGIGAAAATASAAYVAGRFINALTIRTAPGRAAAYDDLQAAARSLTSYDEWAARAERLKALPLSGTASQGGTALTRQDSWFTLLRNGNWKSALFAPTTGIANSASAESKSVAAAIPELLSMMKAELIKKNAAQYSDVLRLAADPSYAIRNIRGGLLVAAPALLASGVFRLSILHDGAAFLLAALGTAACLGIYGLGRAYVSTFRQELYQVVMRLVVEGVTDVVALKQPDQLDGGMHFNTDKEVVDHRVIALRTSDN